MIIMSHDFITIHREIRTASDRIVGFKIVKGRPEGGCKFWIYDTRTDKLVPLVQKEMSPP